MAPRPAILSVMRRAITWRVAAASSPNSEPTTPLVLSTITYTWIHSIYNLDIAGTDIGFIAPGQNRTTWRDIPGFKGFAFCQGNTVAYAVANSLHLDNGTTITNITLPEPWLAGGGVYRGVYLMVVSNHSFSNYKLAELNLTTLTTRIILSPINRSFTCTEYGTACKNLRTAEN